MRSIHVPESGSADVMTVVETESPEPGPSEVAIDAEVIGVNYADIKRRRGSSSRSHERPFVPGIEAAETVRAAGEATGFDVGDRVVIFPTRGAYAEIAIADATRLERSIFPTESRLRRPPPFRFNSSLPTRVSTDVETSMQVTTFSFMRPLAASVQQRFNSSVPPARRCSPPRVLSLSWRSQSG